MELQFFGAVGAVTVSRHDMRRTHDASAQAISRMIDLAPCA